MNDLNSVLIEGNLVKDPEHKYTSSGACILIFCVGNNRYKKKDGGYEQESYFFEVVMFGEQATRMSEFLKKGTPIILTGRLCQDRWQDQDGKTRSKIKIIADYVTIKERLLKRN